MQKGLRGPMR